MAENAGFTKPGKESTQKQSTFSNTHVLDGTGLDGVIDYAKDKGKGLSTLKF